LFFFFILFNIFSYTINITETKKLTRISFDLGDSALYSTKIENNKLSVEIQNVIYNKIPKQKFSNNLISSIKILNLNNNTSKASIYLNKINEKNIDYFSFYNNEKNIYSLDLWLVDNNIKLIETENKYESKLVSSIKTKLPKNVKIKAIKKIEKEAELSIKEQDLELTDNIDDEVDYTDPKLLRFVFNKIENNILNKFASNKDVYIVYPALIKDINFKTKKLEFKTVNKNTLDANLHDLIVNLYKEKKLGYALKLIDEFKNKHTSSKYIEEVVYLEAYIFLSMYENLSSKFFLEQAFNKFNQALVKFPDSKRALHALELLGKIYLDENFNYRALEVFEKTVNRYPNNENILTLQLAQAVSFLKLNQSAKSLSLFKKIYNNAVNSYNKDQNQYYMEIASEAYFRLGDIYFVNNDYQKSIDSYLSSFEVFSDETYVLHFPNAIFNTAQSYFILKNYSKALEYFRSFIKHFPNHKYSPISMNRIGECLHLLSAPEEQVKSAYLETTFRYPDTFGSMLSKLRLAANNIVTNKDKDLPQFFDFIDKVIKENPYSNIDIFAVILKGESLIKRGVNIGDETLLIEAIDLWKKYIREQPLSSFYTLLKEKIEFAICELIELYSLKEDFYNIVSIYESNIDSFITRQNTIDILLNLSEAYLELALDKESRESIIEFEKLKGSYYKNLYLLNKARLLLIDKAYDEAIILLNKIDISKSYSNYRVYGRFINRHKAKYYYEFAKFYDATSNSNKFIDYLKLTIDSFDSVDKEFLSLLNFKLAIEHYRIKDFINSKNLFLNFYETYKENSNKLVKEALYYIAHSYFELKDFKNSIMYYLIAIKEFPTYKDSEMSKYRICKLYTSLNDKENALKCLNYFDKNSNSVWFNLAKETINVFK